MAHIEIDEVEYNRLKGVSDLAAAIHANPEGRKLLERAHKTVNPKAPTPTLTQEELYAAPIHEIQNQMAELTKVVTKRFQDEEAQRGLDKISRLQDEGFERLRQENWLDDGIEKVRAVMTEKGILDVDVAAAYVLRMNPPQIATPTGSHPVNFIEAFNDDSDKALQDLMQSRGESESALNRLVSESLNDFRNTAKPTRR